MPEHRPHRVIAIARQIGAGGAYLGQRLARALGIAYFDREILDETARQLGVSCPEVAQREEHVNGLLEGLIEGLAVGTDPYFTPPRVAVPDQALHQTQAEVIRGLARRTDCVIVGRGAARLLENQPGVLRVFLHASLAWRSQRIQESYHLATVAEAQILVERVDRERRQFYRRLFRTEWVDARHYDLCLNVEQIGLEASEGIILAAARQRAVSR